MIDLGIPLNQFWRLYPKIFGHLLTALERKQRRDMVGHAMVSSVLAEIHRDRKARTTPFSITDFLPKDPDEVKEPEPEQTWTDQLAFAQMLNEMFGGKDLRGNNPVVTAT